MTSFSKPLEHNCVLTSETWALSWLRMKSRIFGNVARNYKSLKTNGQCGFLPRMVEPGGDHKTELLKGEFVSYDLPQMLSSDFKFEPHMTQNFKLVTTQLDCQKVN